ncbi:hypothetical protein SDC9_68027 [bioreactor metagenome]|uniref:Uncharacterized protein n=1 Tax=bioreactor metagenome TaxID=1076179 RepID=A0A644Y4V2_9ZZZZ
MVRAGAEIPGTFSCDLLQEPGVRLHFPGCPGSGFRPGNPVGRPSGDGERTVLRAVVGELEQGIRRQFPGGFPVLRQPSPAQEQGGRNPLLSQKIQEIPVHGRTLLSPAGVEGQGNFLSPGGDS